VILRSTLETVLRAPALPPPPDPEVPRALAGSPVPGPSHALVLTGVRRCGKSTLQAQLLRRGGRAIYASFEDTRLFGLGPEDFPAFLELVDAVGGPEAAVYLDEVQEVDGWQRLVRALLDRGRRVTVTGSNASLLGRDLGAKLTGRHLSFEVFPFS
jgi:hypothetical protein